MHQILATVLFYCAITLGAHAADDSVVQQDIFNSYLKLANEGDVVAQYVVAQRYETGKGIEKNPEKALYWYEQAAKKNYPLALAKLETHKKQTAKAEAPDTAKPAVAVIGTVPAPTAAPAPAAAPVKKEPAAKARKNISQSAPKPAKVPAVVPADLRPSLPDDPETPRETIKPKPVEKTTVPAPAPTPEIVVAKAPPVEAPPAPNINVMQALLAGKWKHNQHAAEYLPSTRAACLQSSDAEIVCFSEEMTRNLENAGLTYNVKSVISGINNKEARFSLRYVYNVMRVGKPYANPSEMSGDASDITMKTGWQEPGITMECSLRNEHSLGCTRRDRRQTYQFVHE